MFLQEGDKNILANVGVTVLVLTAFMVLVIFVANILA